LSKGDRVLVRVYRDKTELIESILKAVNGRSLSASQIMHKSFLSYAQMKQYVSLLIDAGLIKYEQGNRRRAYKITDTGLRFLHLHSQLGELLTNLSSKTIIMH
jgi:predicted transcriptional regulator